MTSIDHLGFDVRTSLDITLFELYRLGLPTGSPVLVDAVSAEIFEDFGDRIGRDYRLVRPDDRQRTDAAINLFTLELSDLRPRLAEARHFIAAFHNRLSHKSLRRHRYGVAFPRVERELRRDFEIRASWGVFGPDAAARLGLAVLAQQCGRYDLGCFLADRAHLSLIHQGPLRYLCVSGILAGSRRS